MKVAIFGAGFVGSTVGLVFAETGQQVICVDKDIGKIALLNRGRLPFFEPDLENLLQNHLKSGSIRFTTDAQDACQCSEVIFICVGTPSNADGSANLEFVKEVAHAIGQHMNGYKIVVNKSTSPVGTCDQIYQWICEAQAMPHDFDVVSNPEFLREGSALRDALCPDRVVIGVSNLRPLERVRKLNMRFQSKVIVTSTRAAELIKYAANAFLATKISYVNELAQLCDKLGVDIETVTLGMGLDPRIGNQFLNAGIGYGGSCFPKDVKALFCLAAENEVQLGIVEQAAAANQRQGPYFVGNIKQKLGTITGKKIAVLGVAFKPMTSDTRESPALCVIRELLGQQAVVCVHDPVAVVTDELKAVVQTVSTPEEAATGADAVVICTEWPMYAALDWKQIQKNMKSPWIFDGRNLLDANEMRAIGFHYSGIGKPPSTISGVGE